MKETLSCASCNKSWKRERARGRKPKLCPKCARKLAADAPVKEAKSAQRRITATKMEDTVVSSAVKELSSVEVQEDAHDISLGHVWSMLVPKPTNWKELAEETAHGSTWQCPKCKWVMELQLAVLDAPTHKCTPASRSQKLERIS